MTLVFRWAAITRAGLERRGVLSAPNRAACGRALEADRLRPLWITIDLGRSLRALARRTPRRMAVAEAFEYMADLMALGFPHAKILKDGAATTRDRALATALRRAAVGLGRGERLSAALGSTGAFSPTALSAVIAAEQTGTLPAAFTAIATQTRQEAELIAQIRKATAYPAFVAGLGVVIGSFITFVVLPRITQALAGLTTLPPVTQFLIGVGARAGPLAALAGLAAGGGLAAALGWYRANPVGFWQAAWRVPLLGQAMKQGLLARYFNNLSTFLRNGFPLLEALDSARRGLRNPALDRAVDKVRADVTAGVGLPQALAHPIFPSMTRLAAERGEETGHTAKYLDDLSRLLYRQMVTEVQRLTTGIERLLLFAVAGFIVFLAVAFLLPIYGSLQELSPYR